MRAPRPCAKIPGASVFSENEDFRGKKRAITQDREQSADSRGVVGDFGFGELGEYGAGYATWRGELPSGSGTNGVG